MNQLSMFDQYPKASPAEERIEASTIEECVEALKEVGYSVIVRKNAKRVKVSWSTKYRWGYTHCELYNKVSIDISIEVMNTAIYSIINSKINE